MKRSHLHKLEKDRHRQPIGINKNKIACGIKLTDRVPMVGVDTSLSDICKSCLSFTDYESYLRVAGGSL